MGQGRVGRAGILCLAAMMLGACHDRERGMGADGELVVFPGNLEFRRVGMYDRTELAVTMRNVGRGHIGIEQIWAEGPDGQTYQPDFHFSLAHTLLPGDGAETTVHFHPTLAGLLGGTLYVRTDDVRSPLHAIPLNGVGVDTAAQVDRMTLDFGRIEVDTEKALAVTFRNPSDLDTRVQVTAVGPDASEFALESLELRPFESRTVQAYFRPARVGVKEASFRVIPCNNCPQRQISIVAEGLDSALVAEPAVVDFGRVPVDRTEVQVARVRNISTEPATVTGYHFLPGADASFSHEPGSFPATLAPGQAAEVEVSYSPGHMGEANARSEFTSTSARHPSIPVAIKGYGGAAELCVSPSGHDFGTVPVGARVERTVNIRNCGSDNGGDMTLTHLFFADEPYIPGNRFFSVRGPALPIRLRPGQDINVQVFYEPTAEGPAGAFLHVRTDAYSGTLARVGFNGRARDAGPCELTITPAAVDFGTVQPGRGAVLGVKINNTGTTICAVKHIRLADSAGGIFTLPGGALEGLVFWPGSYFAVQVAVVAPPTARGGFLGALQLERSNAADPRILIPLTVNVQESCLVASPQFLDFGVARPDCPPSPVRVVFTNQCAAPVELRQVRIGPGTTDSEFELAGVSPAAPRTVLPGEQVRVDVRYLAQVRGMNLSPLYADSSDVARPYLVPLLGESSIQMMRTDRFTQQDGGKVDVLFVVDNTASMVEEQPKLIRALPAFVSEAQTRGVDLHVAVTTTGIEPASASCPGGALGGEAGRLFPADNSNTRILTRATPDLTGNLQRNASVGLCAYVEQGLEAMRRALTDPLVSRIDDPRTPLPNDGNLGFLRDSAGLAVVFVSDEDDRSPDDVETYVRFLRELKGRHQPQRATMYAIAPTENSCGTAGGTGTRYAQAVSRTGGELLSVCAPDYAPLLRSVASRAFTPQSSFPLSSTPDGAITVTVNGVVQRTGWRYDRAANAVVFDPLPPAGARIAIEYRRACVR